MADTSYILNNKLPVELMGTNVANPNERMAATLVKDNKGKGILRTVDAAPVAYDPQSDSKKVQIVAGNDDLGMAEVLKNMNEWYVNDKRVKGITGSFVPLTPLPQNATQHPKLIYGGNKDIYCIAGAYERGLFRYSITDDSWNEITDMPEWTYGGAMVYTGDAIYVAKGNGTKLFWKYTIATNTWATMAEPPEVFSFNGTSFVYAGGDLIYALRGDTTDFWAYSISNNTWSVLAPAPTTVREGSNMVITDNPDIIYTTLGSAGTNNNKKLLKYSISANAWTEAADMPNTANGSLTYTGGDYLYATKGMNSKLVWRYSISNNVWSSMVSSKDTIIGGGGQLTYAGGDCLYALRGNGFNTFYKIPFAHNKWQPWMR